MYTTRPLSVYMNSPEAISLPPEGPNSGYLVLQDEESTPTYLFGLLKSSSIENLPFPQNKRLSVRYTTHSSNHHNHTSSDDVYLIPVINQPLSSNRYYAIKADGNRKGEVYACSRDQDMGVSCFCIPTIRDVNPRPPFDPKDIYQQFEFSVTKTFLGGNRLSAESVAPDGHPPSFLRRQGWHMNSKSLKNLNLGEARGVDPSLRANLPDFSFPLSEERSKSVVVGKWYCPFMFIKGWEKDQVQNSLFYEMTLEQQWERIFVAEKSNGQEKTVTVDVVVPKETVSIAGQLEAQEGITDGRGIVWFKAIDASGTENQVGLSSLIVQRMMWEEERVGWVQEKEKWIRVVKEETYDRIGDWEKYGCFLLVERFVLKKNDGSIVLTYDFRHTHNIRSKWD